MTICNWCGKDMSLNDTLSCSENVMVDFGNMVADPIRYGSEDRLKYNKFFDPLVHERCHDCNVKIGGIHHPGCDMEECPKCHKQLISCGCVDNLTEN